MLQMSFKTPDAGAQLQMPAFQTKVRATHARLIGGGFFDRVHDQTGVSPLNGLELHPLLKIEWLEKRTHIRGADRGQR
jgi:hypothetical protein